MEDLKKKGRRRNRRMDRENFGDFELNLTVPPIVKEWARVNNKVLRFVNDEKMRVQKLLSQDWDFVKFQGGEIGEGTKAQDIGDAYSVPVGKDDDGKPIRAYLMAKEQDWYDEDQKLKQGRVDEIDSEIRRGLIGKVENAYQPKDGSGKTVTNYEP